MSASVGLLYSHGGVAWPKLGVYLLGIFLKPLGEQYVTQSCPLKMETYLCVSLKLTKQCIN